MLDAAEGSCRRADRRHTGAHSGWYISGRGSGHRRQELKIRRTRGVARVLEEAQGLSRAGALEEYLSFTEEAVLRFPDDPDVLLEHAAAVAKAKPAGAVADIRRALELDDGKDVIRLTRAGLLLIGLKEIDAARSCILRASSLGSERRVVRSELARLRGQLALVEGNDEVGEAELRCAYEENRENWVAAHDLVVVLIRRRALEKALEVIDGALGVIAQGPEGPGQRKLKSLRSRIVREMTPRISSTPVRSDSSGARDPTAPGSS